MTSSHTHKPLIIGLTGGIGSGKSTVCEIFQKLGVEVIDADEIARELVEKETPALLEITQHFGESVLNTDKTLNRAALRDLIFDNEEERFWLENLLHPMIQLRIDTLISQSLSPYLILCAPLLLESGHYDFVDRVLVVDVDPAKQLTRTTERDLVSTEDVQKIMQAQLTREERLARADDILDNNADKDSLTEKVKILHNDYKQKSQHH